MGQLLKEVRSTDRGLIGITKEGEEIALNPPTPKAIVRNYFHKMNYSSLEEAAKNHKECEEAFNSEMARKIAETDEETFFQLGKLVRTDDRVFIQPYNIYTRKK